MNTPFRVVVVGGGLAGLQAAIACADAGAKVTLLEATSRLGGAVFSFSRHGLNVDNGQHVFLRCCTAYRAFLHRIGADRRVLLQDRLSIPVLGEGGRTAWLRRNNLPAPLHLAGALARYGFLTRHERLAVGTAALALRRLDLDEATLEERSFGQWLADHGQTSPAVAAFWDLITVPTLNLSASQASLGLAAKVFRTGLLSARAAADIGYATAPLSEVHGDPAQQVLSERGVQIYRRCRVERIREGLTLTVEANGARFDADAVILAVPHRAVARLLPPGAVDPSLRIADLGVTPIVNVHVVYDRRVTGYPFAAGHGTPVQWMFDRTATSGLKRGQYLAVALSAADEEIGWRTERFRRTFLPALGRLLPRTRSARVEQFFVTREPAATFRQVPGVDRMRPGPVTAVPGLYLAGAWTDTGWPDTMEGAVRSGLAAARAALRSSGGSRSPKEMAA